MMAQFFIEVNSKAAQGNASNQSTDHITIKYIAKQHKTMANNSRR